MKKIVVTLLLCLFGICICSCGSNGESSESITSTEIEEIEEPTEEVTEEVVEEEDDELIITDTEECQNMIRFINEENYEDAQAYFESLSLEQSDEQYAILLAYCLCAIAMEYYEDESYNTAYYYLEYVYTIDLKTNLDLQVIREDILEKTSEINGVYDNISMGYDGMYLIINGPYAELMIAGQSLPSEVEYGYTLLNYEFTTGEKAYLLKSMVDDSSSYIFMIEDGNLRLGSAGDSDIVVFSGIYELMTTELPEGDVVDISNTENLVPVDYERAAKEVIHSISYLFDENGSLEVYSVAVLECSSGLEDVYNVKISYSLDGENETTICLMINKDGFGLNEGLSDNPFDDLSLEYSEIIWGAYASSAIEVDVEGWLD